MQVLNENVPWGVVRIEAVGAGGDIPEIDPVENPVMANSGCIVAGVIHPDIGTVEIRVLRGEESLQGQLVFDGVIDTPQRSVVIGDLVGEDFEHIVPVLGARTAVKLAMDDPEEAQVLEISFLRADAEDG